MTSRFPRNPMLGIVILAAALRLHRLGAYSVHLDEAGTYFISVAPVKNIFILLSSHMHNAPPLSYVLMHSFLKVSESTLVFRLPSAIAGVLGVAAIYYLGKYVFSERVGLVSSFLLAISPLHIYHSQEARMYAFFCLFSIVSLLAFLRILAEGKGRHWVLWSSATILNFYTHFFAVLLLLAQLFWMTLDIARKWSAASSARPIGSTARKLVFALFPMAISIIPLSNTVLRPKGEIGTYFFGPPLNWTFFKNLLSDFSTVNPHSMWPYFLLFVIGLMAGFKRDKRGTALLFTCAVITTVLANLYLHKRSYFAPKYLIMILPVFLVFVAAGVVFLAETPQKLLRSGNQRLFAGICAGVCGILVALPAPALSQYYQSGNSLFNNPGREAWDKCVAFVKENAGGNDAIGFYQGYTQYLYDYYDRGLSNQKYYFIPRSTTDPLQERSALLGRHYNYVPLGIYPKFEPNYGGITGAIGHYDRLWMVYSSPYPKEGTEFLRQFLGTNYQEVFTARYGPDLELVLYDLGKNFDS